MYTLPCKLASEKLYVAQGAQLSACDDLEEWDGREKGSSRGRGYMYTYC